jgi:hypothetical protein
MRSCFICGRSGDEVRLRKAHAIPRFLDKSKKNQDIRNICRDCEIKRVEQEYILYQSYAISANKEFYNTFLQSTFEIEALAAANITGRIKISLDRLLYANIIAAVETYLSDAFINIVISNPDLIRKLVETNPEFKKRKFDLSDIYNKYESLESEVREYLVNIIYHNLAKVKNMYKSVLNIDFPSDLSRLYTAIMNRHDIVHRNGKNKEGQLLNVNKKEITELISDSRRFVEHINLQLPILSEQRIA